MEDLSQGIRLIAFVIYTILWEVFIWGGTMYLVYFMDASVWLILLAALMSGSQFQPRHFGLKVYNKKVENMDEDEFKQYKESIELQIQLEKAKKGED